MQIDLRKLEPNEFPSALREIPEPPEQLWIEGVLPPENFTLLTVVGSRKHTAYGKDACAHLIAGLRGYPVAIVSGLALGIDTIAHDVALQTGLPTMAVPGSGLAMENIYPRSNVQLARKIVEQGGCLLSEYAPDFTATPWSFPRRNRIMAGLAKATLVIEAEMKSGTRITARLATDYNREVFAVPGNIFSEASKGTNALIGLGATPISSTEDLIHALGFSLPDSPPTQSEFDLAHLNASEQRILEQLREPRDRDELFRALLLSPSEGSVALMKLEIAGYITDAGGNMMRRM